MKYSSHILPPSEVPDAHSLFGTRKISAGSESVALAAVGIAIGFSFTDEVTDEASATSRLTRSAMRNESL